VGGGADSEAMFSSGCASCCYKQRQGWTQGEEATVMSIENMEIYKLQGGGPTELRPCGSIKRNESVPIDHEQAHTAGLIQCASTPSIQYPFLFSFSITVIVKVFVVLCSVTVSG